MEKKSGTTLTKAALAAMLDHTFLKASGDADAVERLCAEAKRYHFACAMVLARNGQPLVEAVGRVHGSILFEERGENGFGYDSLFFYEPKGKTFAELDAEEKNTVSHRKNALALVLAALD